MLSSPRWANGKCWQNRQMLYFASQVLQRRLTEGAGRVTEISCGNKYVQKKMGRKKKKCLRCKTFLEYFSLWQHGVGLAKLHCFETCSWHIVMRVTITTSIFALQAASTELFRSPSSKLASFFRQLPVSAEPNRAPPLCNSHLESDAFLNLSKLTTSALYKTRL